MSEGEFKSEINIGLPNPASEALFVFAALVKDQEPIPGAISIDRIWHATVSASPEILDVLSEAYTQRGAEVFYLPTDTEEVPSSNEKLQDTHMQNVEEGFKLGTALVMYAEFFEEEAHVSFEEFLKTYNGRARLPVTSWQELERVNNLMSRTDPIEVSFTDEYDDDYTDASSMASRDSNRLLSVAYGVEKMLNDLAQKNATDYFANFGEAHYKELVLSYYYGFEQALEMFVQSCEVRVLAPLRIQLNDIDTSGLDAA